MNVAPRTLDVTQGTHGWHNDKTSLQYQRVTEETRSMKDKNIKTA